MKRILMWSRSPGEVVEVWVIQGCVDSGLVHVVVFEGGVGDEYLVSIVEWGAFFCRCWRWSFIMFFYALLVIRDLALIKQPLDVLHLLGVIWVRCSWWGWAGRWCWVVT